MRTITRFSPTKIRDLRDRLGLLQRELAEKVGVKTATICHWESGFRRPSNSAKILLENLLRTL